MVAIDANDARPGTKILLDGQLYNVIERAHHKPGKGGAFVRFKLKGLTSGKVIEYTVRAGTTLEQAAVSSKNLQFLFKENDDFIFMDPDSYEQVPIRAEMIGFTANFLSENAEVQVTSYEDKPIGIALPPKMEFEVVDTVDAVRGNTATNVTKEARINTGMIVNVPLFIKIGDRIRVSTDDGSYLERV
ncbi:MAG: elongation factor P [bacterium]|nr:elongation factor P [bacterium]